MAGFPGIEFLEEASPDRTACYRPILPSQGTVRLGGEDAIGNGREKAQGNG